VRKMKGHSIPIGLLILLTKEGCIDTEVNEAQVIWTINIVQNETLDKKAINEENGEN
jgi:hypothetical protein